MARPHIVGATAAAMLPAALAAAALVSAPFAGTTTAPLAKSTKATAGRSAPAARPGAGHDGLNLSISAGSIAMLVGGELMLVGVGAGVIVVARRRRYADD